MAEEDREGSLTEDQLFDLLFRSVWHGREGNVSGQLRSMTITLLAIGDIDMDMDTDSLEECDIFVKKVIRFEANFYEVKEGGVIDWQIMGGLWKDLENVLNIVRELDDEKYQQRYYQSAYKNTPPYPTYEEAIEKNRWIRMPNPNLLVDVCEEFRSRLGVALKMSSRLELEQVNIKVEDVLDKLIKREKDKAPKYSSTTIIDRRYRGENNIQIQTDPDLFEYMLSRLLSNFYWEIREESSSHISIWTEGNSLFIADDGTGFTEDYIAVWENGELPMGWDSTRIDMGGGVGMSMVRVLSDKLGFNVKLSNGKSSQYPSACIEIRLVADDPLAQTTDATTI